jgi:hypothetical protein
VARTDFVVDLVQSSRIVLRHCPGLWEELSSGWLLAAAAGWRRQQQQQQQQHRRFFSWSDCLQQNYLPLVRLDLWGDGYLILAGAQLDHRRWRWARLSRRSDPRLVQGAGATRPGIIPARTARKSSYSTWPGYYSSDRALSLAKHGSARCSLDRM